MDKPTSLKLERLAGESKTRNLHAAKAYLGGFLADKEFKISNFPPEMINSLVWLPHDVSETIRNVCDSLEGVRETPGLSESVVKFLEVMANSQSTKEEQTLKASEIYILLRSAQEEGEPRFADSQIDRFLLELASIGKKL